MPPGRPTFGDVLLVRTIAALETAAPLDDGDALRAAARATPDREARLVERARALAARIGLDRDLARLRQSLPLAAAAAAVLVALLTWSLLRAVIGDGRSINAIAAFASVLGLHFLSLAAWLLALPFAAASAGGGGRWGGALGRFALGIAARWPALGGANGPALLEAGFGLLRRERLLPWVLACLSHAIWALAFMVLLPLLFWVFAFSAYRLSWETTILSADFFVDFVRLTGTLPQALGLPVPEADAVRAVAGGAADHRLWAWWLLGCTFAYGLLPRLVLALVCWTVWRTRSRSMRLDLAEPGVRRALARLDALATTHVVDAEHAPAPGSLAPPQRAAGPANGAPMLVGFELPERAAWPPEGLAASWPVVRRIAGSASERRTVLELLAAERPRALLVVCDGATSPDRGTARFLREALAQAGRGALLLVAQAGGTRGINRGRWSAWLEASALAAPLALLTDSAAADAWQRGEVSWPAKNPAARDDERAARPAAADPCDPSHGSGQATEPAAADRSNPSHGSNQAIKPAAADQADPSHGSGQATEPAADDRADPSHVRGQVADPAAADRVNSSQGSGQAAKPPAADQAAATDGSAAPTRRADPS